MNETLLDSKSSDVDMTRRVSDQSRNHTPLLEHSLPLTDPLLNDRQTQRKLRDFALWIATGAVIAASVVMLVLLARGSSESKSELSPFTFDDIFDLKAPYASIAWMNG
eukprot:393659_1